MRWREIREADERRPGPLSGAPIRNTGELGHLEDVLNMWVEGDCAEAEPYLLAMRGALKPFAIRQHWRLYRGILLEIPDIHTALSDGITIHHAHKSLESWAHDPEAVDEFMAGWDRPWILIEEDAHRLDVLIDLEEFSRDARPITRMDTQAEVIVLAAPSVYYRADQISVPYGIDELNRYEASLRD